MISAVNAIQNFSTYAIKSIQTIPGMPSIATFEEFLQAWDNLPWGQLSDALEEAFEAAETNFLLDLREAAGAANWSPGQWYQYLKGIQDNAANPFHDRLEQLLAMSEVTGFSDNLSDYAMSMYGMDQFFTLEPIFQSSYDAFLGIKEVAGANQWSAERWYEYLTSISFNIADSGLQPLLFGVDDLWDAAEIFEEMDRYSCAFDRFDFGQLVRFASQSTAEQSAALLHGVEREWYDLAVSTYIQPVL